MNGLTNFYAPNEAWDELADERSKYMRQYQAAYSGDHLELAATAYAGSFWARNGKARIHVPLAADIAAASADLLFGNPPRCRIYDDQKENVEEEKQNRLDAILRYNGFESLVQEAAEEAAVTGDVFLKCNWDDKRAEYPYITFVSGDEAIAEYRFGRLLCVHFFTVIRIERETGVYWRLYERYEEGRIISAVYVGDTGSLGSEWTGAMDELGIVPEKIVPGRVMLAAHIPNIRPSRVRFASYGRSEFEGMRDMMDSLDEVYSSWMRDVRLAKARLLVPAEFLRKRRVSQDGTGNNDQLFTESRFTWEFDEDVETLVALDVTDADQMQITPSQFAIRAEEHAKTAEALIRNIISMCGYSPQTFGLDIEGQASSGTALLIREKKSFSMRAKKLNYWSAPLENFLTAVLQLDAAVYHTPNVHEADRVIVDFPDAMSTDLSTVANAVKLMRDAQTVSVKTAVRMLHPDWEQGQIDEETEHVMQEFGTADPKAIIEAGDLHKLPEAREDQEDEDGDA